MLSVCFQQALKEDEDTKHESSLDLQHENDLPRWRARVEGLRKRVVDIERGRGRERERERGSEGER